MESLLDPPQSSKSLLSAEHLDTVPIRFEDGDVARLEVCNHVLRTFAGSGERILLVWIAKKGDGEIGKILAPRKATRGTYDLKGSVL